MRASFNPRARAGRDIVADGIDILDEVFQSTRPRGARHERRNQIPGRKRFNPRARAGRDLVSRWRLPASNCFNPRARAGRDQSCPADVEVFVVSIHAPARGATGGPDERSAAVDGFNPRARAGRDQAGLPLRGGDESFNPRARAGRDLIRLLSGRARSVFQSTRPRGARRSRYHPRAHLARRFNPRARAGRDAWGIG